MRIIILLNLFLIAYPGIAEDRPRKIRVATFNVSLFGRSPGDVADRLADGMDAQAEKIASIIQEIRPDILLVNELDHDPAGRSVEGLLKILSAGENSIDYPHWLAPASNTGVPTGMDLDGDGSSDGPGDAYGFGRYSGQYALAILSRFPIEKSRVHTFEDFRWSQLPDAIVPMNPDGTPYYDEATWSALRLSSKNHVDVPIRIGDRELHLLASHPTPPVFDGPEDRNGRRNHDEIRFWNHYLDGTLPTSENDEGKMALEADASFVIAGDLNSDSTRGDSIQSGIADLLSHPRLSDARPRHDGQDTTALFGDRRVRVDYVLPSRDLVISDSGVYWPTEGEAAETVAASDHRLVWIDIETDSIRDADH